MTATARDHDRTATADGRPEPHGRPSARPLTSPVLGRPRHMARASSPRIPKEAVKARFGPAIQPHGRAGRT
ncbi:hypothetical protein [Haladaptatus sp. DYF46]|uniref:hypothetical protein n=1 Tax=Haladaptatus sp. DYF46 TaxID=2886041 RepID=UPI001E2B536F|nr:hypothetical protein [Haladaptatus sp. DYF46]